jgi:NADPH:quinone reductase
MRAEIVRVHQHGGPEAMRREVVELPPPGPGEALVAVRAAGVNFIDVYHRTGFYKAGPLPYALGQEGAGEVVAVGDAVDLAIGARVAWAAVPGSYASHVIAPADRLVELPAAVSDVDAAAVMLQGMTAHYLVRDVFPLSSGDTCLVHAAAGGVGLLLCQLARAAGATVLGTTSTAAKAERARAAGADHVALYDGGDLVAWARGLTRGAGVEVAYDSVGLTTWESTLRSVARRGLAVFFGQSSGAVPPIDPLMLTRLGSLFLTRPALNDFIASRADLIARAGAVLDAVGRGDLTVAIDRRLPLDAAAEAHRLLESRTTVGKLVLTV